MYIKINLRSNKLNYRKRIARVHEIDWKISVYRYPGQLAVGYVDVGIGVIPVPLRYRRRLSSESRGLWSTPLLHVQVEEVCVYERRETPKHVYLVINTWAEELTGSPAPSFSRLLFVVRSSSRRCIAVASRFKIRGRWFSFKVRMCVEDKILVEMRRMRRSVV